jgi:1,2-diacylglycerol 3-alpha-glucosyltransferase
LKTEVVPISSGIDLRNFSPEGDTLPVREKYGIPNKPVLLFVGRLDPEKNIEEILNAVAIAVKKNDFYFVIVGRGVRKSALERHTKKLGISDRVIFTGFVPDEDLPYIYKLSRCFIISSVAELLSLGALQGMASGLPVIAVKIGALVELVHDGVNGYLYEAGDIGMIVQSILRIFSMNDIYRHMSEKSLEISHDHDINKTISSFEKLYDLVGNKRGAAELAPTDLSFA